MNKYEEYWNYEHDDGRKGESIKYFISKKIKKHYKKYGKNFQNVDKKHDLVYKIHYFFCILLVFNINNIDTTLKLIAIFIIEMFICVLFAFHPRFCTPALCTLPVLGVLISIITFCILNCFKLNININHISTLISILLNLIVNTFILLKVFKNYKSINLSLTVKDKIPIDYDYSNILFEDNNQNKYFIITDLDEKFNKDEIYELKIKRINISSKPQFINKEKFYEIKEVDASTFKLKL